MTIHFSDDFNRADSTSDAGNGWTNFINPATDVEYGIKSNQLYVKTNSAAQKNYVITRSTTAADVRRVSVKATSVNAMYIYLGRNVSTGDVYAGQGYVIVAIQSLSVIVLRRFNAGTPTNIAVLSQAFSVGDRFTIERVMVSTDNYLNVYLNGARLNADPILDNTYPTLGYVSQGMTTTTTSGSETSADEFRVEVEPYPVSGSATQAFALTQASVGRVRALIAQTFALIQSVAARVVGPSVRAQRITGRTTSSGDHSSSFNSSGDVRGSTESRQSVSGRME